MTFSGFMKKCSLSLNIQIQRYKAKGALWILVSQKTVVSLVNKILDFQVAILWGSLQSRVPILTDHE
jgi:hypothetical protein